MMRRIELSDNDDVGTTQLALDNLLKSGNGRSLDVLNIMIRELGMIAIHGADTYAQLQRTDRDNIPEFGAAAAALSTIAAKYSDMERHKALAAIHDKRNSRDNDDSSKSVRNRHNAPISSNGNGTAGIPPGKGSRLGTVTLPQPRKEDMMMNSEYNSGSDIPSSESGSEGNVSISSCSNSRNALGRQRTWCFFGALYAVHLISFFNYCCNIV